MPGPVSEHEMNALGAHMKKFVKFLFCLVVLTGLAQIQEGFRMLILIQGRISKLSKRLL